MRCEKIKIISRRLFARNKHFWTYKEFDREIVVLQEFLDVGFSATAGPHNENEQNSNHALTVSRSICYQDLEDCETDPSDSIWKANGKLSFSLICSNPSFEENKTLLEVVDFMKTRANVEKFRSSKKRFIKYLLQKSNPEFLRWILSWPNIHFELAHFQTKKVKSSVLEVNYTFNLKKQRALFSSAST